MTGGNEIGNPRLTRLMEGALEIFQDISQFIQATLKLLEVTGTEMEPHLCNVILTQCSVCLALNIIF